MSMVVLISDETVSFHATAQQTGDVEPGPLEVFVYSARAFRQRREARPMVPVLEAIE